MGQLNFVALSQGLSWCYTWKKLFLRAHCCLIIACY